MPTYFQRPENALKRANEFIGVGKKQRALDALYDVIKSKRHRTWQKIHEPIMEKYLFLCVELKKSQIAKEGLYQYKNICQQVNTKSLEDVIKRYLALAEERTENARQQSQQSCVEVEDLDVIETPESLLMSAVSGEDTQDRTDRAILTPWLKFLWESYRQCLDLLRNNNTVEKLYQEVAQNAFKFCNKYGRKTEFRKLCDNLRTHLGHITKHQNQQRAINLNNPESQAMHLETRLVQLDHAISMELWQEAYKAVEDIHSLIVLSRKQPRPSLLANYYQKFSLVLAKAGNHLFHACALHRLFHLYREQRKNASEHEIQKLASRVLCATLAIPLTTVRTHTDQLLDLDDSNSEKQKKLAGLLSLSTPHTRSALVKDLVRYGIIQHVHPELSGLYQALEVEFHPLDLSNQIAPALEFLAKKDDLSRYVSVLQDVAVLRVVKQLSQVYQTIQFSCFAKLVPFADAFRLERILVEAAKSLDLQVRIDHRNRSLSFGTDLNMAVQEEGKEGPHVQNMPGDQIRSQLLLMARALDQSINILSPTEIQNARDSLRLRIMQMYRKSAKGDHEYMLRRRHIIEERKEEIEHVNTQREREEQEILDEQRRKQYEAEMARLEREAEERENQRRIEERRDIQKKCARERLEQIKNSAIGAKAFADLTEKDIEEMDMDDILAKQVEQLEKEKREREEKLKLQEKKVDYFERAKWKEEIPLLEKLYENETIERRQFWELTEKDKIETMIAEREHALEQRDRLMRVRQDRDEFIAELKKNRADIHKQKLAEFDRHLCEQRKRRLEDRRRKRMEDRKEKWLAQRAEEKQRKIDEELKRKREEEERVERERREKEEAEYSEKMRKLNEIEEKKRQRELEIEEKRKRELQEAKTPRDEYDSRRGREPDTWRKDDRGPPGDDRRGPPADDDKSLHSSWRAPVKEGGWREREKIKDESWKKRDFDERRPADDKESWSRREDDRWRPAESVRRDVSPPPRDEPSDWRRATPREDRGPPSREDRGPSSRDDHGPPSRDDRAPLPRGDRFRDGKDFRDDRRDERGGPPRDFDRSKDDRDDAWRRGPPRDDRGGPMRRDDRGFRDDRGPPSRDDRGPREDRFRDDRGPPRRDDRYDRGPRDDRGPPSRDDRGPRGGGSSWRGEREGGGWRGGDRDFGGRDGPPRGEREWRRDGPPKDSKDDWRSPRGMPPPRDKGSRPSNERPTDRPSNERLTDRPSNERPERGGQEDGEEGGWKTVRH